MFPISEILNEYKNLQFVGDESKLISKIISATEIKERGNYTDCIVWVSDKNADNFIKIKEISIGLLVVTQLTFDKLKNTIKANFLIAENPRLVFANILKLKFSRKIASGIERTAIVDSTAIISEDCYIGKNVIIERNVVIGKRSVIMHNTVIMEDTLIGENVIIGCNNTIGNYGFGYEKDEEGLYQVIEHIGRVIISNHVHIHNNVCIDRGVLGETFIGENVKIDNLVHVAHGVRIEKNSLIIANAMLGGSVQIGENCWIAPSTTIKNKIYIADNTLAGLGCVILKDTQEGSTMIGNPAVKIEEYKAWSKLKEQLYINFNTDLK